MTELERVVAFHRYLEERCSDRIFPSHIATGLLNSELPLVHDRNYLRVEDEAASASELASFADRLLGAAGIRHRKVFTESAEAGERMAPQFTRLGWKTGRLIVMAHAGAVEEEPLPVVAEVDSDSMLPFWRKDIALWRPGEKERGRQLVQENVLVAAQIDARFFVRRVDGKVVSACHLYSRGATAQIERVSTLPDYRNRGLASSVVSLAVAEARRAGHDLIWLLAEEDDWPKALYAKMGFSPIGRLYSFKRP